MNRKFKLSLIGLLGGTGVALGAPVIPVDLNCPVSYEYELLDTPSGEIEDGYYIQHGDEYSYLDYFTETSNEKELVTFSKKPQGLKKANIIGKGYNDLCEDNGDLIKIKTTSEEYNKFKEKGRPNHKIYKNALGGTLAEAAISYDTGTFVQTITGTSLTFSHTVTGSDTLIAVMGHDGTGGSSSITGVTYAGVSLTKAGGAKFGYDRWITMWYLAGAATGDNNVVVSSGSSQNLRFSALSYTGVASTPEDATLVANDDTSSSNTTWTNSITTNTDGAWAVLLGKDGGGNRTYTLSSAGTMRLATDAGGHWIADSGEIATAGATTLNGTVSSAVFEKSLIWAFKPAGGGGGGITPRTRVSPIF